MTGRAWTYDHLGRLSDDTVVGAGLKRFREHATYTDSNEVDVLTVYRDIDNWDQHDFLFDYDNQHQLTKAEVLDGRSTAYAVRWDYTPGGQLASVGPVSPNTAPVGRDQVAYSYGTGLLAEADEHAVASLDGPALKTGYKYDFSGNTRGRTEDTFDPNTGAPLDTTEWTFKYDGSSNQREAQLEGGGRELYYYDDAGQRYMAVRFTGAGTLDRVRVWNGAVETWYTATGKVLSDWAHVGLGAQSIGRIDDQTDIELSFHNGLQHFMGSLDFATGDVETAFIYGPYGELIKESSSADTAMHLRRFNGKEDDELSKLSYYGYRYYDSQSLTWTSADPLFLVAPDIAGASPRETSLYMFSLNNPVRFMDPDGRYPGEDALEWIGEGIEEVAAGAVEMVKKNAVNTLKYGPAGALILSSKDALEGSVETVKQTATAVEQEDWDKLAKIGRNFIIAALATRALPGAKGGRNPAAAKSKTCFTAGTPVATAGDSKPIEELRVGDRVRTDSLQSSPTTVVEGWLTIELAMPNPDGSDDTVDIVLLRSPEWAQSIGAKVGGEVELSIPEMGLVGVANVRSITSAPEISDEEGRVLTGTFTHLNSFVYEITLQGGEVVQGTRQHPVYSADRQEFVRIDELQSGELLRTSSGTARVKSLERLQGDYRVYNIEVEDDHVYFVGDAQVLVHNQCAETPPGVHSRPTGAPKFAADSSFGLNNLPKRNVPGTQTSVRQHGWDTIEAIKSGNLTGRGAHPVGPPGQGWTGVSVVPNAPSSPWRAIFRKQGDGIEIRMGDHTVYDTM